MCIQIASVNRWMLPLAVQVFFRLSVRHLLSYSTAAVQCKLFQKELTCEGDGVLTQEIVQAGGPYTKYETAIVKSGITSLDANCFVGCSSLYSVTIPEGVTTIGSRAFDGTALQTAYVPKSVTTIGTYPWNGIKTLQAISVNSGNSNYASYDGVVYTKDYKTILHVPAGKASISFHSSAIKFDKYAMRWNTLITDFVIPSGITTVGTDAFYACGFVSVTIPASVTSLETSAFSGCTALRTINVAATNQNYYCENGCFGKKQGNKKVSLIWVSPTQTSISLGLDISAVDGLGYQTLPYAESLTNVTVASGHTTLKTDSTKQLVIGWNIKVMGCVGGATSVTVPSGVTHLEQQVFRGCKFLTSITLASSLTEIRGSGFRDCPSLVSVDFANCNPTTMGVLLFATSGNITLKRWSNVKTLTESMFEGCHLEEIDIKHVVTVGRNAFLRCSKLRQVTFKDVETIKAGAFTECPSLSNVDMSLCTKLKTIESTAFASCKCLEKMVLPACVENLQASSFAYNPKLTSITFHSGTSDYKSIDGVVYTSNLDTLVICPSGRSAIRVVPDAHTIGYNAFYGCGNLVDVIMDDHICIIEGGAFYDCSSIEFIRLPSSVQKIGTCAVHSCGKLKKILFCNNRETARVEVAGEDPFPTNPEIWVFHDYTSDDGKFLGHKVRRILDYHCNIPTNFFTATDKQAPVGIYVNLFACAVMEMIELF